jgi:hypothetical protein
VQGDTAPNRNNSTCRRSETPRRDKREMEEGGTQILVTAPDRPSPIGPLHGCPRFRSSATAITGLSRITFRT